MQHSKVKHLLLLMSPLTLYYYESGLKALLKKHIYAAFNNKCRPISTANVFSYSRFCDLLLLLIAFVLLLY